MTSLPKFKRNEKCPKCGNAGSDVKLSYHEGLADIWCEGRCEKLVKDFQMRHSLGVWIEHLSHTCQRCRYVWVTATIDPSEDDDE